MSQSFELMNKPAPDPVPIRQTPHGAGFGPGLPPRRTQWMAGEPDEMFTELLWRIIRNRKSTIMVFAFSVVVLVLAGSLLMKPKYDAVGRMVVVFHRSDDSGVLGFKGVDNSMLEDPDNSAAIDTQIGILQTDALAIQVIHDLHLDKNPLFAGRGEKSLNEDALVKAFHNSLNVSKVKATRLIQIKFRSRDPHLSADVVNDLAKEYVDQYYRSQIQVSQQISGFLSDQLKELKAKVEDSQQKLLQYQKDNGIVGLNDKQNIVTSKLDDLNKDLTAAEDDRIDTEVDYRLAHSGRPDLIAKLGPDNLITKLRSQESDLENQLAQASVQLGPANPKIVELSKQLAQVRKSLRAEVNRINERLTYQYQGALEREHMLRTALEGQKQKADKLDATAAQAEILEHDYETNRKLYEDLLQKQKEIGISASLKSSNIWIVDPARAPILPAEPNIPRNIALSLVGGVLGGVLLAYGLERMNVKISTLEQALTLSPLPSLGVLPLLETKRKNGSAPQLPGLARCANPALACFQQPMSIFAESYKAMVTSLMFSQPTPPKVIMVTSALPGEGKTTVSSNLAIELARLRRRVLLVDADLRRPNVHLAMQLNTPRTGLGMLLNRAVPFEEVVVGRVGIPNLLIMPVGPVNLPDDAESLLSGFKDLVESWRGKFDHIIIDTPPILAMTDAVRMSLEADSVILVIRADHIDKDSFVRAQNLLLQVNARLAGFVLNGAEQRSRDFRYYYGYYSHGQTKRLNPARKVFRMPLRS